MAKIKLPEVPGDLGWEGGWEPMSGKQSRQMLHSTLGQIQLHEDEIIDELGVVEVTILPTNRVLLTSRSGYQQVVAYMADPHADGRLVLDDYIPELSGEQEDPT